MHIIAIFVQLHQRGAYMTYVPIYINILIFYGHINLQQDCTFIYSINHWDIPKVS